jgi:hypothetical protein
MDNRFDDPGAAPLRAELEEMVHARPGDVLEAFDDPVGMA